MSDEPTQTAWEVDALLAWFRDQQLPQPIADDAVRIVQDAIAEARRKGAAEVAERVETDVLSGWQAEAEDSVGTNVVIGVEVVLSSVRAALRGDA